MASEGANPRLGITGQPAGAAGPHAVDGPAAHREQSIRALDVGARLLCGATTFFFLAFLFAYFYLRSIDQKHFWKPTAAQLKEEGVTHASLSPNQALGAAFAICIVVSALLAYAALQRQRSGSRSWVGLTVAGLAIGLAAVALQCIEYTKQSFGPTDGGYASVFCAWTALYLVAVMCTMYWLEIDVATELRARRNPSARRAIEATEHEDPDELLPRGMDAVAFYWAFLAAIGVITYVVLYLL
jgi:heme/copper-type cytochrome/quinol oxidase subunit 3